jgi:hypothetical protein
MQKAKPRAKRAKSKSKKNHYFTKDTEMAIVEYARTEDITYRTKLYIEHIQPAFNELVDKIVYTYKFTSLQNVDNHKEDCKIWLTTILDKYNPDRGTKAFSYFSVVTKNWFTHKAKKQTKRNKREIEFGSVIKEIDIINSNEKGTIEDSLEDQQFWAFLLTEVSKWGDEDLRENERKVLDAIQTLMNNIEQIEIFNKKAIYLYMREITGLNTKQIVSSLKRLRQKYADFRKRWLEGEV